MKKELLIYLTMFIFSAPIIFIGCKKSTLDTTKPVITLNGLETTYWQFNKSYSDLGASANDDKDGTVAVTTSGNVNPGVIGAYTINYSATDAAGNIATATRTVYVVNFCGTYNLVQTLCTDTSRNTIQGHPDSAIVNAAAPLLPDFYDMSITNFGRRTANLTSTTFYGNLITVYRQANLTGTAGDQIEATGTISGTGVGANKLVFTFHFIERTTTDSIFNQGTTVFTHR